ncbi:MAG: ribonuclease HII [Syntrophomonadaceae bacterium]|nr:ribonuclease HII [Syntrophomonadaceae bacterium]
MQNKLDKGHRLTDGSEEVKRVELMKKYELAAYQEGFNYIAGIDEAGRGPIAGPVVAAAVILPVDFFLVGVDDSKKLSARKRAVFSNYIKKNALSWAVSMVNPPLLDDINILNATKLAMQTAISSLTLKPDLLLIDAVKLGDINIEQKNIIKGDSLSISIAAASIIAKVERDRAMENLDILYPNYGLAKHKGYPTKEHKKAVLEKGPTAIHRQSFEPVKSYLNGGGFSELTQPNLFG